eukprot:symbB.v1.2.024613.t1/scaffold2340.1/size81877/8
MLDKDPHNNLQKILNLLMNENLKNFYADLLKEPPSELVCRIVLASQTQSNKENVVNLSEWLAKVLAEHKDRAAESLVHFLRSRFMSEMAGQPLTTFKPPPPLPASLDEAMDSYPSRKMALVVTSIDGETFISFTRRPLVRSKRKNHIYEVQCSLPRMEKSKKSPASPGAEKPKEHVKEQVELPAVPSARRRGSMLPLRKPKLIGAPGRPSKCPGWPVEMDSDCWTGVDPV